MTIASRRAQRIIAQKAEVREWRLRQGVLDSATMQLSREGFVRQERPIRHLINWPGWKPEVEAIEGEGRGVYCKTAGGIKCYAQDGPDELNIDACRNCNVRTMHDAMRERQAIERRALEAKRQRWLVLKRANPATRRF